MNSIQEKVNEFAKKHGEFTNVIIFRDGSGHINSPEETRIFEFRTIDEFLKAKVVGD